MSVTSGVLLGSSVLCMVAALLHFACVFIGSRGYRMMGAGEKAVRAVEAGEDAQQAI